MEKSAKTSVRRRRWIRRLHWTDDNNVATGKSSSLAIVDPITPSTATDNHLLNNLSSIKPSPPSGRPSISSKAESRLSVDVDEEVVECEVEYDDNDSKGDVESVVCEPLRPEAVPRSTTPKQRTSFFSFASSNSHVATETNAASIQNKVHYQAEPALRIHGTTLTAIGKQIVFLESASKKAEDIRKKAWKDQAKPKLEAQVAELEKKIASIKSQLEREAFNDANHINRLDEDLRLIVEQLDSSKRKLYFPTSPITLGQGGVYLGLTDFWLEESCGSFSLELSTVQNTPIIRVQLAGTSELGEDAGVTARVKIEGFKLVGDKGKGVPKISFDNLNITVAFSVMLKLSYDQVSNQWRLPKSDLILKIISFKGPYGLNRRYVVDRDQ